MMDPGYLREGINQALDVVGAMPKDVGLCVLAAVTRIIEDRPDASRGTSQPVKRRRVRTVTTKPVMPAEATATLNGGGQ